MSRHVYPAGAIVADYARALVGFGLTAVPLMTSSAAPLASALFGTLAFIFVLFALRTAEHHLSRIEATEVGLAMQGLRQRSLVWSDLHHLKLTYYSTRRDRTHGWLQLTLADRGRRFRIDSRIEGFDRLAALAVAAANTNRLNLDDATLFNLRTLGTHRRRLFAEGERAVTNLLQVRDLQVEFQTQAGVVQAVSGLSFRVRPGSSVALVGESGSGKSVTAQAIMGLLPRTARIPQGEILLADPERPSAVTDLAKLDPSGRDFQAIRGNRISMIFQEPMTSLSPLHTVGDQVSEALLLHRRMSKKDGYRTTVQMLNLVGFPDAERAYHTYPFELSGGLRQRAMIAMALICRPALLIADEPSTALDVTIQAQILKLIQDLQADLQMALLIITHDLGVVANVAEEVVVMYQGRVMESGTLDDIFKDPRHPYLKALLRAVPHFDMKSGERLRPLREISYHAGHLLGAREPPADGQPSQAPLLEVRNLTKSFSLRRRHRLLRSSDVSAEKVVDDVSFRIEPGGCFGLVGESGCGKSTVSKIIMRAVEPDEGEVIYHDSARPIDVLKLNNPDLNALRRKIQYVFQDPYGSLNPRMTVFDILSEPLVIHAIGDDAYRREMVSELMRAVGLDPRHLGRYPHSFSGGQRQRIAIARALALKPDLLICDEPVSALDVSVQAQILNLLKDLQAELGLTYLFISHNLAVVDYMANRIAVMCAGQLVEEAPRDVLFRDPVHPYTRALLAAVPYPDPDRRLDFSALMDGRASLPQAWPPPFTIDGKHRIGFFDLGGGHFVRAWSAPLIGAEQVA